VRALRNTSRPETATAPQESTSVNRESSSHTSRLELRAHRPAQVKDAASLASNRLDAQGQARHAGTRELRHKISGHVTAPKREQRTCRNYLSRWAVLGATLLGLIVPAFNAASAQAVEPPKWKLTVTPSADYFLPSTPQAPDNTAFYTIEAENVSTAPTSEATQIVLQDTLPNGLAAEAVQFYSSTLGFSGSPQSPPYFSLSELGFCPTDLRCEYPGTSGFLAPGKGTVPPGQRLIMLVRVDVPIGFHGSIQDLAEVSGGGAPIAATATATNQVNPAPPLGFHAFAAPLTGESAPYTQAGGHPRQFTTEMDLATRTVYQEPEASWGMFGHTPIGDPRDIAAELPPGLIGNPQAVPRCPLADFFSGECEISTVVGTVAVRLQQVQGAFTRTVPLFNLLPSGAYPGELGYIVGLPFFITAHLRSGSDYGLTLTNAGTPPVGLNRVDVTTWGVPAAPEHNALRGKVCLSIPASPGGGSPPTWRTAFVQSKAQAYRDCEIEGDGLSPFPNGGPAETPEVPFLTLPTQCSGQPLAFGARYNTWELGAQEATASATDPSVDGCNQLSFEPTIEARPTTNLADAPSGFDFNLKVPQNHEGPEGKENPEGFATADLREAVVKLPPGLTVNPSSGAGLEGCSPAQIGLTTPVGSTPAHFTESPANCPDAARLGTVEVKTALLHNPLLGSVYLATPHQNPSGNLLAGYIALEGEGIIIKLAGQFHADPVTGQITASFLENPQTPFEEFKFHFFEGARGPLRTPAVCGTYETTSTLTPYSAPESGPPATPTAEFETTAGSQGGSCPRRASAEPNAPVLHAGTESPQAGAYSPFSLKLVRQDGSQEVKSIDTTLPAGLTGKLAGIAECSDAQLAAAAAKSHSGAAEQASPSCPPGSEVGTVDVASGAGPTPLIVSGKAYLAGPYKGAPLSLAIVTPAVAGPFDLGTVVVRTALYVDPETAQIHAVSDPIPTILEGIPLDVRSVTLKMARPDFTLNPTNCEPLAFTGSALSVQNVAAPLLAEAGTPVRFQVGGCSVLPFKPKLSLQFKGSVRRLGHPGIVANLKPRPGDANIAFAQVQLPKAAFLDQGNLVNVCTKVQFAAEQCPPGSIYGKASATSPLLDYPLSGNVYLRSPLAGHKLPDLVADLHGPPSQPLRVVLVGKTDSVSSGALRNTFEATPDVPVSSFHLELFGGPKKSLVEMSSGFCANPNALVRFVGQNGKAIEAEPKVRATCAKKKGKHGKRHHHRGHR
jgi:uncharacterized repeat protein (TIGR01451 family)